MNSVNSVIKFFVLAALLPTTLQAAVTINTLDTAVVEDFTGFTGGGFSVGGATPGTLNADDWADTGLSDNSSRGFGVADTSGDHARGDGGMGAAGTTGGFFRYDVGGGNDAFGIQPGSSDWTPGTLMIEYTNNTGSTATSIRFQGDLYFNNDQDRSNSFTVEWNETGAGVFNSITGFTSPGADDTNGFTLNQSYNVVVPATIAHGDSVFVQFRGNDAGGSGSRDEFAIDNISITLSANAGLAAVPEPGTLGMIGLGAGLILLGRQRQRRVEVES